MSDPQSNQPPDPENSDAKVNGVLNGLHKNYMLIGKTHIKTWHGFLILGLVVGLAAGILLIANRSGGFQGAQAAGLATGVQTLSVNGYNIYSPAPVLFNNQPRLYFGGWLGTGLTHDNIYVADCPFGEGSCSNARKVIDSVANGFEHVNDPTIVLHPATQASPAYYTMYLTGVPAGESGLNLTSNKIYYSTSWADDGINWSRPALLFSGFWLPSATMKNGRIELFANSTIDGRVAKFDLGESGTQVGTPAYVAFDNPPSVPPFYSNVDVVWRPALNAYQIFAERALRPTVDNSSVIDYLTSSDGVTWHLANSSIISSVPGQFRVGTPAQWIDSAGWVYFGSTVQSDSMGFKIYFARWEKGGASLPTCNFSFSSTRDNPSGHTATLVTTNATKCWYSVDGGSSSPVDCNFSYGPFSDASIPIGSSTFAFTATNPDNESATCSAKLEVPCHFTIAPASGNAATTFFTKLESLAGLTSCTMSSNGGGAVPVDCNFSFSFSGAGIPVDTYNLVFGTTNAQGEQHSCSNSFTITP